MAEYIKIDDDTYAKLPEPDPSEIIKLSDLQDRINWLNNQIKTPENIEQLQAFWDAYYGNSPFKSELEKLNELLQTLQNIN